MNKHQEFSYVPGTCNLGKEEIIRRHRNGYIGFGVALLLAFIFELSNVGAFWKLFTIIPLFYGFSGFIQAWKKFCYVYGWRGVFSIEGIKKFSRVTEKQYVIQDRKTAIQIILLTAWASLVVASAYYFLST